MRWLSRIVVPCLALTPALPALAQAAHGSLVSRVLDPEGHALVQAQVTVVSQERGTAHELPVGPDGVFEHRRLVPGRYRLTARAAGFKTAHVEGVRVSVDLVARVEVTLSLGDVAETLTVEAASPLLKTDRADVSTTIGAGSLLALPNPDRNFTRFLLLTPGAQLQLWQHAPSENPQASMQIMVNGQHFSGTAYQLDGVDNREPILGIAVINPSLESIAEAKVTSQNFGAEFGQAVAGVVSVQTRSGTNSLAGSAFEQYQGDRFQARNPFTQPPDADLPESRRHLFGGALGGPLRRDRAFFFADYQGQRSTVGASRLLTVPTARARGGDLSEYGVPIFDPAGGEPGSRAPFPGNVIPGSRLSPQALSLLSLLPLPNRPGLRDNYLASGSETFDQDQFNVRLDGRVGASGQAFARYTRAEFARSGPPTFGVGGGPELVSQAGSAEALNQSLAMGYDTSLGAATFLEARFGWYRYQVDVLQFDFGTTPAADAGLPGLNNDLASSGLPAFRIEGPFGFNFGSGSVAGCNCPLRQDEEQFQAVLNARRSLGLHTVEAGLDVRYADNLRIASDKNRSGELSFSEQRTRGPEGGGLGLAGFLLGDVSAFSRFVSEAREARERQWRRYFYVQDTWRARPDLTITAGLRLDDVRPQTVNGAGNGGWLDLATGEIRVAGLGGIGLDGDVKPALHWAPRFGLAWRIDEQTVLRAGFARSHDIGVFGSTFGHVVTQNLPVQLIQDLSPANAYDSVFDLAQGPPAAAFPAPGPNGRFPLPVGALGIALPERMRLPRLDAWNLALQRQFLPGLSAEIAYVGNRGSQTFVGSSPAIDANEPTLAGYGTLSTDERRPFYAGPIQGLGAAFGWTQEVRWFCACGETRYDALQARVLALRGKNSMIVHYTRQWAREDGFAQFLYDPTIDRGRPNWDRQHMFVAAFTGEHRGFRLGATATVASGLPFDVTYREAGADRDAGHNRPDVVGDPAPGAGDGVGSPYFNATPIGSPGSAFARPAAGTLGDLERGALSGPGYWRVDAALSRLLRLRGAATLELRVEVVNLFNHVNLDPPDAEVGVAGNENPNAGYITATAYGNRDPQRNLLFGVRLAF